MPHRHLQAEHVACGFEQRARSVICWSDSKRSSHCSDATRLPLTVTSTTCGASTSRLPCAVC
jgi:hypothetical protein